MKTMRTISETIKEDHRELERYYNEIVNSADHDHQQRFGNQFTWELARHSIAEELIIYPAFENYLGPEGHDKAESDRKQHHEVKVHLKEFQNMSSTDPDYVPKLKELWGPLSQHIKEEERDDLPALEKKLEASHQDTGVSERLAKNFDRTKKFVPSRSHPSLGENPAFESVMGMLATPIDRIADMFRKFPVDPNPDKEGDSWRDSDRRLDNRKPLRARLYSLSEDEGKS
ncbi:hypothetical protein K491DRAFT_708147 [Lophiostoma macrostomum CBS 122681]|uniref:Hemerythrin-like domain-containing protein n=1 Tax=Lophiostoma macrostomum CBS 122681 TaxID=1314788 RepID=A0A6A6SNH6_9PLEO|nr:hypothetical protein K491DRAFT_708147 [Lophiostoma macrostomum CBS 122681]